jgi:hypothetical protein
VKGYGLRGCFLEGNLLLCFLLFGGCLFRTVELEDRVDANAVGAHRLLGLLGCVLGVANLALDLYVRALLERGCELAELAEDDAAMPFSVRDVFAGLFVLVRGLGCEREGGELLGSHLAKLCERARLPSAEPCFLEQGPRLALGEESGKQNGDVPPGVVKALKQ